MAAAVGRAVECGTLIQNFIFCAGGGADEN
jgi:hypothetical protein